MPEEEKLSDNALLGSPDAGHVTALSIAFIELTNRLILAGSVDGNALKDGMKRSADDAASKGLLATAEHLRVLAEILVRKP